MYETGTGQQVAQLHNGLKKLKSYCFVLP